MNKNGKAGCGCFVFILVAFMVLVGLCIHPFSLRFIGNQLRYEDKVFPSDAIFVPRFSEDKNGELYGEAFKQYLAGKGKTIWVEDEKILGMTILDIVTKMASAKGIDEGVLKKIEADSEGKTKASKIQGKFGSLRVKKVIIIVPEYASREFHLLYGPSEQEGGTIFLIKPVEVGFFKKDSWWKDPTSRSIFFKEVIVLLSYYTEKFKYTETKR